ncbi:MAG: fimbrillin family protein [Candidatus Cryptobacteroides sp.]
MNKGIICLTAFLCVCLAGCRKSDPELQLQGSIRFAIDEVKTRSNVDIIENVDQLKGRYIRLWGFRYTTKPNGDLDKSDSFMENYEGLMCNVGSNDWYTCYLENSVWSNNTYYWTPGAAHRFYAVFPTYAVDASAPLGYTIDEDTQVVHMPQVTAGTRSDYTNNCQDILYGIRNIPEQFHVQDYPEKVQLTMRHACAALVFRIRNLTGYPINRILPTGDEGWDKMYIKGVKYIGQMDLDPSGISWTLENDLTSDQLYVKPLAADDGISLANGATSDNTFTAIVLPQNFGSASMPHRFCVYNTDSPTPIKFELDLAKVSVVHDGVKSYEWRPGYRYIYTMDVTDTHIICTVSVVPWIEDETIIL